MDHVPTEVTRLESELRALVSEILSQDPDGRLRIENAVREAMKQIQSHEPRRFPAVELLKELASAR